MLENNHEKKPKKYAGILAHPTSFPSPYGIGDLGKGAYRFIDFLANSGLNLWQVLPLGLLYYRTLLPVRDDIYF